MSAACLPEPGATSPGLFLAKRGFVSTFPAPTSSDPRSRASRHSPPHRPSPSALPLAVRLKSDEAGLPSLSPAALSFQVTASANRLLVCFCNNGQAWGLEGKSATVAGSQGWNRPEATVYPRDHGGASVVAVGAGEQSGEERRPWFSWALCLSWDRKSLHRPAYRQEGLTPHCQA